VPSWRQAARSRMRCGSQTVPRMVPRVHGNGRVRAAQSGRFAARTKPPKLINFSPPQVIRFFYHANKSPVRGTLMFRPTRINREGRRLGERPPFLILLIRSDLCHFPKCRKCSPDLKRCDSQPLHQRWHYLHQSRTSKMRAIYHKK
jgi:hypothetical protein